MRSVGRWLIPLSLLLFLALQLVRPELKDPPVTAELQAPPEVRQILRNSCYNCHSNETKLSWFDRVVPAYWLVTHDVTEARKHINFSEIAALPAAKQKATLFEAINRIQLGAMPLPSYKRMHPGAVVTDGQLAVLRAYLKLSAATAAPAAPAPESGKWIPSVGEPRKVQPALNGIAFPADYKNWQAISSTERFDDRTIRAVLGNPIAMEAIASNHINPWPDGTMLAKVAWAQRSDGEGLVRAGAFLQVAFMIRDSKAYASTKGWGWARWHGIDLKPYGADAGFASECVNCHMPLRHNDYVFTMPILFKTGRG